MRPRGCSPTESQPVVLLHETFKNNFSGAAESWIFFFFFKFLVALSLRGSVRTFSSCGTGSAVVVHGA